MWEEKEESTQESSVNNLEIVSKERKPRRIISNSIFSTEIYDSKDRILLRKKKWKTRQISHNIYNSIFLGNILFNLVQGEH